MKILRQTRNDLTADWLAWHKLLWQDLVDTLAMKRKSEKKPVVRHAAREKTVVSRSPRRPMNETILIYRPDDFALSVAKLFPKEKDNWKRAASDKGFLRIRPEVRLGIVGLYGSLALGNPPSPTDIDAWEASKPKDCWDYYGFLDFVSVPADGPKGGLDVVLFHRRDSFEQRPLEIVGRVHLSRTAYELGPFLANEELDDEDEQANLVREWARLLAALKRKYGTADLGKQKWTVDTKVYDITYPDQ